MKTLAQVSFVALGLIVGIIGAAEARHSNARHCADDYRRFCHQWGLETRGLLTWSARVWLHKPK
jgi:hypothetical protein